MGHHLRIMGCLRDLPRVRRPHGKAPRGTGWIRGWTAPAESLFVGTESSKSSAPVRPHLHMGSDECRKLLRERRERPNHGHQFAEAANACAEQCLQWSLGGTTGRVTACGSGMSPFHGVAWLHLPATSGIRREKEEKAASWSQGLFTCTVRCPSNTDSPGACPGDWGTPGVALVVHHAPRHETQAGAT